MSLTNDELFLASTMFKLEVYKRTGQEYENFFCSIMRACNPDFEAVKPQGIYGDRKNDGFIKLEGKYYQVYSPENPSTREAATINKLVTDFAGLYNFWNPISEIKEFNFVLNDKFAGAYASLHSELSKIETQYPSIRCKPFLAQHLEDKFFSLSQEKMQSIIGLIPAAEEIRLNISYLDDVIQHLLQLKKPGQPDVFPTNPDFEEKIVFNQLSEQVATILRFSSFQIGELEDYFKLNSNFYKDRLKDTFNQLYTKGLSEIADAQNKNDMVFFSIANNAYPSKERVYQNAVFVLMSYFFSYCDIFEEPVKAGSLF